MSFAYGLPPKQKRGPKQSPLDNFEDFLMARAAILNGRLGVMESCYITFTPDVVERLGLKHPGRTTKLAIERLLKQSGLESEYALRMFKSEGVEYLTITHEPPNASSRNEQRSLRPFQIRAEA